MTATLGPCPGCSRHIKLSEDDCPFCGASVQGEVRSSARRLPRVGRVAAIAAMAAAGAAAGCGPGMGGDAMALYGAPAPMDGGDGDGDGDGDGCATADAGVEDDGGQPAALYGAPDDP